MKTESELRYVWSEYDKTLTLKMNWYGNVGGGDFLPRPGWANSICMWMCNISILSQVGSGLHLSIWINRKYQYSPCKVSSLKTTKYKEYLKYWRCSYHITTILSHDGFLWLFNHIFHKIFIRTPAYCMYICRNESILFCKIVFYTQLNLELQLKRIITDQNIRPVIWSIQFLIFLFCI